MIRVSLWATVFCSSLACSTQAFSPAEDVESREPMSSASGATQDTATANTSPEPTSTPAGLGSSDADTIASDNAVPTSSTSHDAGEDGVRCDTRKLTCKRAAPACDFGYVPRIIDGCYGDCVAVETCICSGPEECPDPGQYTCNNSRDRCTPYLR